MYSSGIDKTILKFCLLMVVSNYPELSDGISFITIRFWMGSFLCFNINSPEVPKSTSTVRI